MVTNRFSSRPPVAPASAEDFVEQAGVGAIRHDEPPASTPVRPAAPTPSPRVLAGAPANFLDVGGDDSVYRSVPLRLSKANYRRLKMLSTITDRSMQDIALAALLQYLEANNA